MAGRKPVDPEKRKGYGEGKITAFCKNVRAKRMARGLTQDQLGERLGIHPTRISEIEGGRFPTDPERVVALADALQCSLDELFRPVRATDRPQPAQAKVEQDSPSALTAAQRTLVEAIGDALQDLGQIMQRAMTDPEYAQRKVRDYFSDLAAEREAVPASSAAEQDQALKVAKKLVENPENDEAKAR